MSSSLILMANYFEKKMEQKIVYKGRYKDDKREVPIEISNDGNELSFFVDGLKFVSTDFEEWILQNPNKYSETELEQFSFSTHIVKSGFSLATEYILNDCTIQFCIPQRVFDAQSMTEITIYLEVKQTSLGIDLSLKLPDNTSIDEKNIPDFEIGLKRICSKIGKGYSLFNCFTCRYSSYSIYGNGVFGSLLCYRNYKEKFLKIKNKEDYSHVQNQGFENVQETDYCNQFQLPTKEQFLYKEDISLS